MIDLRLGDWRTVLADVECDALICDPPYSARNESGHNAITGAATSTGGSLHVSDTSKRTAIGYGSWTPADVSEFVAHWSPRVRGWMVCLTSHDLIPAYEAAHAAAGRYCFAPVPCVIRGMGVRMMGDGPSSWTVYAVVARPRSASFLRWGTLPGAYVVTAQPGMGGGRGKPIDLMRALVKDYSRPGDLICDPCAGWGTTAIASRGMGRRFVGSEIDPSAHAEAMARIGRPVSGDLLAGLG